VETFLLNQVTFQTTLATKAARCRMAAGGKIGLVDFSLRRKQGVVTGLAVARLSALVGFSATSNVEAARSRSKSADPPSALGVDRPGHPVVGAADPAECPGFLLWSLALVLLVARQGLVTNGPGRIRVCRFMMSRRA
jgi:hypothetical protein